MVDGCYTKKTQHDDLHWRRSGPYLTLEYFLSAKQQFKLSVQWVGIEAVEDEFYRIPDSAGRLVPTVKPDAESDSFSISDLVFKPATDGKLRPI